MIGKVTRGQDVKPLLSYLYGPGRRNEHVDPHLVAGFRIPTALEAEKPNGDPDVRYLADVLSSPLDTLRHSRLDRPVWQCSIRAAPDDRRLSDAEWADIAEEVVHQTGFAPRADDQACRWAAVRHADDHIHIVVVLAREDGRNPSVRRDYLKVRTACQIVEERYGLTRTAPADQTATPRPTRAEVEHAQRKGLAEPPRDTLRRAVVAAATGAAYEAEFFALLRGSGTIVKQRISKLNPGEVTGYAVALADHTNQVGEPVWFSGGKLAPELTLPKLRRRWGSGSNGLTSGKPVSPVRSPDGFTGMPTESGSTHARRTAIDHLAARTAVAASQQMRWTTAPHVRADIAAAASDVLHVTAAITRNRHLAEAADSYARAAREPHGHQPMPTRHGNALRLAGRALAMACLGRRRDITVELAALLEILADIAAGLAEHRQAQRRHFEAKAARTASACLRGVSRSVSADQVAGARVVADAAVDPARLAATDFPVPLESRLQDPPTVAPPRHGPPYAPGPRPSRGR
ncbi:relaxase/mobilization nuclease domain-containing protein [Spirillospora sp. NBC_01491]|uniref:relaxase/mobilization nuclease domain-containing protein n=1 Tax=Spirillospora sp. NBC_01491 TaxID=2976007 RepID=UPI002E2F2836|nr:hypothetical protein [Spirillospora sp. NBC_01491]